MIKRITTINEWKEAVAFNLNEEANFPAQHNIDDMVEFIPMYRHQQAQGISAEIRDGKVVAVRFSKAKVFYDILDDYYGIIFDNVDSSKVFAPKIVHLEEEPDSNPDESTVTL